MGELAGAYARQPCQFPHLDMVRRHAIEKSPDAGDV